MATSESSSSMFASTTSSVASSTQSSDETSTTFAESSAATSPSSTSPDTSAASVTSAPLLTEEFPPGPLSLNGAPLVFAPTADSFSVSAVILAGDPVNLTARVRREGAENWGEALAPLVREEDLGQWTFEGLEPDTRHEYQVLANDPGEAQRVLFDGHARTQRPESTEFTFAMLSDTHIGVDLEYTNQGDEALTARISAEMLQAAPDFVLNLGDVLDYHQFGFNVPPSQSSLARTAYQNYRGAMGNTIGHLAHFSALGNWDGENGDFSDADIMRSREQRQLYLPNPGPNTYPEGGSPGEDYYAFTWGDATFVVLNVMSYTPTAHLLTGFDEYPDDWTLGSQQLSWLETTLSASTSKWKFLFIHHTVGGAAPDAANAAYGRGGGQAAYVGEQAVIHQMMLDYGAQIFFHGHDHVFVDMQVDGIHYSDPGSAGAPWKFTEAETGYTEYWTDSGWAKVTVSPERVHVEFIAEGGVLLHEYVIPEGEPGPDSGVPESDAGDAAPPSDVSSRSDAMP